MNKVSSKKIGLDLGLTIGRFFLNTEDLHYGYWPDYKNATIQNLSKAQEEHSKLIISKIPKNVKSILDVGSGSGNLALKLSNLKYDVDCVIPSPYLANEVALKLNNKNKIHIQKFEKINDDKKYDLILFSESFQYVKINQSLTKMTTMLKPNGYILICDFFKRNIPGKSPLGGGHSWEKFIKNISEYPYKLIHNQDITKETAPTIDLLAKFNNDVLTPMVNMSNEYLIDHYPKILKFFKWKFRKRLNKIYDTYLSGNVNGNNFIKFKQYYLLIYQKTK